MSGAEWKMAPRMPEERIREAARKGTRAALERLAEASGREAPSRSGALRASCRVETAENGGSVAYGAAYAAAQHENTALRHPGGGKARFLADPARDAAVRESMLRALAEACRKELG